jgi:hypothetical protein
LNTEAVVVENVAITLADPNVDVLVADQVGFCALEDGFR